MMVVVVVGCGGGCGWGAGGGPVGDVGHSSNGVCGDGGDGSGAR